MNVKKGLNLAKWCSIGAKISVTYMADLSPLEGLVLENNAAFVNFLDTTHIKYDRLFEKRAFVHWFVG